MFLESELEDFIFQKACKRPDSLRNSGFPMPAHVSEIKRQVNLGVNGIADIIVEGYDEEVNRITYIYELKRHRVGIRNLDQLTRYMGAIQDSHPDRKVRGYLVAPSVSTGHYGFFGGAIGFLEMKFLPGGDFCFLEHKSKVCQDLEKQNIQLPEPKKKNFKWQEMKVYFGSVKNVEGTYKIIIARSYAEAMRMFSKKLSEIFKTSDLFFNGARVQKLDPLLMSNPEIKRSLQSSVPHFVDASAFSEWLSCEPGQLSRFCVTTLSPPSFDKSKVWRSAT